MQMATSKNAGLLIIGKAGGVRGGCGCINGVVHSSECWGPAISSGLVEQQRIDRLGTMHTSIARGNVLCKNQTGPALPLSARSVTEEKEDEEDDDDEKFGNRVRRNFARVEKRRYIRIILQDTALAIERPVGAGGVFLRRR